MQTENDKQYKLVVWLVFTPFILGMTLLLISLVFLPKTSNPPQPQKETQKPSIATWVRVDSSAFHNSSCDAFCRSRGTYCSTYECQPDHWCQATGGMMEIETWNQNQGVVCDRVWQGNCSANIDRYPPSYNFHCCCK